MDVICGKKMQTENGCINDDADVGGVDVPAVLMICPTFFDYYKDIIKEFERRRLNVKWLDARVCDNSIYKLLLRVMPRAVAWFSTRWQISRVRAIETACVKQVFVIKGEGLSPSAIRELRRLMPNARFYLYLWDGIENVPYVTYIAPLFDSVATFDPDDSQRFGWHHRPLFGRHMRLATDLKSDACAYDWVFIGSLHSDRYKILRRLVLATQHLRSFVFGFIPGKLVWWLRHLTDFSLWRPGSIRLSTTSLDANAVQQIVDASQSALDIEHPKQKGLTMRSIETLMSNRKLITTNQRVRESELYDESRVCVIDRNNPVIPEFFFASSFKPIDPSVCERYSIGGWLDEILTK